MNRSLTAVVLGAAACVLAPAPRAAFAQWQTTGNDIYYAAGAVGIGTEFPGSGASLTEIGKSSPPRIPSERFPAFSSAFHPSSVTRPRRKVGTIECQPGGVHDAADRVGR